MSIHRLTQAKRSPLQGLTIRQPMVTTHGGVLLVAALLTLLTEFGIPLTDGQQSAITKFIAVAGLVVAAVLARRKVTPTADPRDNTGRLLSPRPAVPPLPSRNAPSGPDSGTAGGRDDTPGPVVDVVTDVGDEDEVESGLERLFGNGDPTQGRHHLADDQPVWLQQPPAAPLLPQSRGYGDDRDETGTDSEFER